MSTRLTFDEILKKHVYFDSDGSFLKEAYSLHRFYHDQQHIVDVYHNVLDISAFYETRNTTRSMILTAAVWHDAVYVPGASFNEFESAIRAVRSVSLQGNDMNHERLYSIIRDTEHKIPPLTFEGSILCDADLAPLAVDYDQFVCNAEALRKEYAYMSDDEWERRRKGFLSAMLQKPSIYHTMYGRGMYEDKARANIKASL